MERGLRRFLEDPTRQYSQAPSLCPSSAGTCCAPAPSMGRFVQEGWLRWPLSLMLDLEYFTKIYFGLCDQRSRVLALSHHAVALYVRLRGLLLDMPRASDYPPGVG